MTQRRPPGLSGLELLGIIGRTWHACCCSGNSWLNQVPGEEREGGDCKCGVSLYETVVYERRVCTDYGPYCAVCSVEGLKWCWGVCWDTPAKGARWTVYTSTEHLMRHCISMVHHWPLAHAACMAPDLAVPVPLQ
jgi:hypothetical protein